MRQRRYHEDDMSGLHIFVIVAVIIVALCVSLDHGQRARDYDARLDIAMRAALAGTDADKIAAPRITADKVQAMEWPR